MAKAKANYKKLISVEEAPVTKKEEKTPKPLGIVKKGDKVRKHFLLQSEDEEALRFLVQYAEKKLSFRVNHTKVIQILVRGAAKHPAQFIKWVKL